MTKSVLAAAIAASFLLPATAFAQQQSRVNIPSVELFATVSGKWVLDPRKCRDIREDVRDARVTQGRRDRREDRQDQRVADCPASAYTFVLNAGQGPKYPVRVGRGRVPREYRGRPMFINGDTIGSDGRPVETPGGSYTPVVRYTPPSVPTYQQPNYLRPVTPQPTYQQPTYQTPTYRQPTYQAPTYQQPTYQQPTYQAPTYQQPTYQTQTPAPAPAAPSNYEIRGGVIYWLD